MRTREKKICLITLKIFSSTFLAIGAIFWSCLIYGSGFWISIVVSCTSGLFLLLGLSAKHLHGSAIVFNHQFGVFIGLIVGLLIGLIFGLQWGVIFGMIFCFSFSAKYLVKKIPDLTSEIKYFWDQIKESIF